MRLFFRIFVRTWGACAGLALVAYLIGAAITSSHGEEGAMNFGPLIVWLLSLFVLFIAAPNDRRRHGAHCRAVAASPQRTLV